MRVELRDVYKNGDVSPLIDVSCRLYRPDGVYYASAFWDDLEARDPGTYWSMFVLKVDPGWFNSNDYRFENWPGRWTYQIYVDDGEGSGPLLRDSKYFDILEHAPLKATSPSPTNGAINQSVTVDVSWSNGGRARTYDVYFGTNPSPGSVEFKGNQSATTYDPGTLSPGTTYYWRIDARNSAGVTAGDIWHFTTLIPPPSKAISPNPANLATGQSVMADLSWSNGGGATSYDVYFGACFLPSSPASTSQAATSYDPGTLLPGTTYFWRVDARNDLGVTVGDMWSFSTAGEPPSGNVCAWRPWAASWSLLNSGMDLYPPNNIYNPTNWDYLLSQQTVLNLPKDTPDGSSLALHWFLDSQPPATSSSGAGSGGVFQEITVQPGVPLKYSFWWKGGQNSNTSWFEFMLIDGPFTIYDADQRGSVDNPYLMRKRESATFGWEQLTDQSVAYPGPVQSTLTPTGNTVTVVLKAGRAPAGAMEALFDDVRVWQNMGPNLVVNGGFEDEASGLNCDNQLMYQDWTQSSYWLGKTISPVLHTTVAPVNPTSHDNASDTTMIISGTDLNLVIQAKLVPIGGGDEITGDELTPGTGNTTLTVTFPTTGAVDGLYSVLTSQAATPCLTQSLSSAFELTCSTAAIISNVSPPVVTDPSGSTQLTIVGTNLNMIFGATLAHGSGNGPNLNAAAVLMDSSDLLATFDLSCVPAGTYDLVLTRSDICRPTTVSEAVRVVKTPPSGGCVWQPWASHYWSQVNTGPDLSPPNLVYNSTNWDYSFSQHTNLGVLKDTPDGSPTAFHFFWDSQPPDMATKSGSGGIYQKVAVTPGVPIEYSFWWKGQATYQSGDYIWYELRLLDGPLDFYYADGYDEAMQQQNNPYLVRRKWATDGNPFGWEQITDQMPADQGDYGLRPQTITPVNDVVTVVFVCGRVPQGRLEFFLDNVEIRQNGGPNLVGNGDFELGSQVYPCENEWVFQDPCEAYYWWRSPLTPEPPPDSDGDGVPNSVDSCPNTVPNSPVDANGCPPRAPGDLERDGDVDQNDFAVFRSCLTGPQIPQIIAECQLAKLDLDEDVDQTDFGLFQRCVSGENVLANPDCAN